MRLSNKQKEIIGNTAIKHFGGDIRVYLFGSRVLADGKGGDIDLFLEDIPAELATIQKKIDFIVALKKTLGDQKIDVVFEGEIDPVSKFRHLIEETKIPIC